MSLESRSLTLKPCPFCGGTPVFRTGAAEGIPSGHFLECDGCHASTALVFPLKDDVTRDLAERWNKRAPVSETGRYEPNGRDRAALALFPLPWHTTEAGFVHAANGMTVDIAVCGEVIAACVNSLLGERPRFPSGDEVKRGEG